jgi:hypothetical protein
VPLVPLAVRSIYRGSSYSGTDSVRIPHDVYWIYVLIISFYGPGYLSRRNDWLRAGRSEDRISGTHPASCTMGSGSFPGVKRAERGADHSPEVKRVQTGGLVSRLRSYHSVCT